VGLIERVAAARRPRAELGWRAGPGVVDRFEAARGHSDERFSPELYGDYIATSSEVYSAALLRARLMSGLPLRLYAGRGSAKQEVSTGPAAQMLRTVNPHWTWPRLARMDELCMCLWGESYWAVERGPDGMPLDIYWMKPSRVRPVPHETKYLTRFLYESQVSGELIPFEADEVVWFRYPNPVDEFSALSPLGAARLAADTASAMMKSNRALFTQGLQLGGLVVPDTDKVTFTKEQAEELQAQLDRRFRGVDKAHKWAVLRYEAQFRNLGVTPKDAEFVNGLNLTLRQVCNAYGIPSPLLNDLEHATLANAVEFQKILWSHALVPDAGLKAGEIEEQFLPMFGRRAGRPATADHCEHDFSGVPALQESATEAWSRERQAIEIGRLTINEIRARAGEPPVPWGDVWWAPVNKSAVRDADSTPQGDTAPTGDPAGAEPDADASAQDGGDGGDLAAGVELVLSALNGHSSNRSVP